MTASILHHVGLKIKSGGKFFDYIQFTKDYPSISINETFKDPVKLKLTARKNIWLVTNRFKYKFFSVITQMSATVLHILLKQKRKILPASSLLL